MSYNTKVYLEQGGNALVVDQGGKIGRVGGASFTIGAEASNAINVAVQLTDAKGDALDERVCVTAFLSDASTGDSISGTAPATSVAIGTDGSIIGTLATDLAWIIQAEAGGSFDLDITETGADTWYLVVVLPDGTQVVSDAITFAA